MPIMMYVIKTNIANGAQLTSGIHQPAYPARDHQYRSAEHPPLMPPRVIAQSDRGEGEPGGSLCTTLLSRPIGRIGEFGR
ncbi:hypothetical protein [Sphingomonas sp. PAMC 26605]|uniref:hypothetical protein n=1 Tax=Sphingomonas sp. PAMC 26605 TaxID=1112214 RepID=UPI0012F4842A|nr:hypothetical protein [Sphingomonas sp. PAMC 26605]